ncbi:unnamed protein product [Caenorhabditis sp. 36 PRJEB53466]|nr:unnamed protein product [Caenorhabditis sp. 36 PRJEB53466]
MLTALFFLLNLLQFVNSAGKCAKCIQRGEVYCPGFDRCGVLPLCLRWIDKLLNCPDTRNLTVAYDEQFARTKMMPLAAAAYSADPIKCLRKVLPDAKDLSTYRVRCSYETDSFFHISTSWLAYLFDELHWIDYNPPPLISSDCTAFVAIDDVAKVVVMSFRGTEGTLQLLEQVLQYHRGTKPFFENGRIYEYFYNAFHLLWTGGLENGVRETLAQAQEDYELWITGYSLGGALASVTSSYIAKLEMFAPNRTKLMTFGQPRTADYDHAAWHDATFPYSFRVINGRDPVPHIPPKIGPLALFHHGTEVWYPTEMWPLSERRVCAEADGDLCSNQILLYNVMDHSYYYEVNVEIDPPGRGEPIPGTALCVTDTGRMTTTAENSVEERQQHTSKHMEMEMNAPDGRAQKEQKKEEEEEEEGEEGEEEDVEMTEEERVEEESSEEEQEPVRMERVKRACAIATEAMKEEAKRAKRSLTLEGSNCVLRLGNCKTSVTGGHRLSSTEACCASCFMTTFRGRDYENGFLIWKKKAMDGQTHIRSEQFVKRFVNSQFLPYYKKCSECGKYTSEVTADSLSARQLASFRCENCESTDEEAIIEKVRRNTNWYANDFGHPPLLQNNVSYDLLVDHYVTRTSGMDATCQEKAELIEDGGVAFRDTRKIMNMFYVPFTDVIANIVHPEFMETDEKFAFPKFADDPWSIYYLQVRNTIIAMWLKHPFVELTVRMVESQIIVRGHARIFFIEHLIQPILEFLTIKGVVNYGAFDFRIEPVRTNANGEDGNVT